MQRKQPALLPLPSLALQCRCVSDPRRRHAFDECMNQYNYSCLYCALAQTCGKSVTACRDFWHAWAWLSHMWTLTVVHCSCMKTVLSSQHLHCHNKGALNAVNKGLAYVQGLGFINPTRSYNIYIYPPFIIELVL